MIPLSAMTATRTNVNPWLASIYAGVFSAIAALALVLLFNVPLLWPLAGLLIGAGPVLGYDLARRQLGANWKPVIGGLIGNILYLIGWVPFVMPLAALAAPVLVVVAGVLSAILWPIVVGLMSEKHGVGSLLLGSLLGLMLAIVVFLFVFGSLMGQNPSWVGTGVVFFCAVWAGTCGAALAAWSK